jgi:hypothetical protein
MMTWREQKREARRILHDTMQIEALYYASHGASPETVHVRLKIEFDAIGNPRLSAGRAEMQSVKPHLIFMRDEKEPKNGAVVWFETGEAYRIDNTLLPDDITRTAEVTRLSAKQYAEEFPDEGGMP